MVAGNDVAYRNAGFTNSRDDLDAERDMAAVEVFFGFGGVVSTQDAQGNFGFSGIMQQRTHAQAFHFLFGQAHGFAKQ